VSRSAGIDGRGVEYLGRAGVDTSHDGGAEQ
jgi:hypothetical protein